MSTVAAPAVQHLSLITGSVLVDRSGGRVGRVEDVIVRLGDAEYPTPVLLVFIWRLAANRELMGEHRNGRIFDLVAFVTMVATSTLSVLLLVVTFAVPLFS